MENLHRLLFYGEVFFSGWIFYSALF